MGLSRKRPETISVKMSLTGQLQTVEMNLVYNNITSKALEDFMEREADPVKGLLHIVNEWDNEYPLTTEGVEEMESDWPGATLAIIQGFHDARRVQREKN